MKTILFRKVFHFNFDICEDVCLIVCVCVCVCVYPITTAALNDDIVTLIIF